MFLQNYFVGFLLLLVGTSTSAVNNVGSFTLDENEQTVKENGEESGIGTANISAVLLTEKLEVDENTLETVSCRAEFEDSNETGEEFTLEWFDEDGSIVSTSQSDGDHQITYQGTSMVEGAAYLFASGKVENGRVLKNFSCQAKIRSSTAEARLQVQINVPLTLATYKDSSYICLNAIEVLFCTFRGFPYPQVYWEGESDYFTNHENEFTTTKLYISDIFKSYTCVANSTDDGENKQYTFMTNVRDNKLNNVVHNNVDANSCKVSWNGSEASQYTSQYLVIYRLNEQGTVTHYVKNKNNISEHILKMNSNDLVNGISVSMVMENCTGPSVSSQGQCFFAFVEPPKQPNAGMIAGLVVASVIAIGLLGLVLFQQYQKRKQKKQNNEIRTGRLSSFSIHDQVYEEYNENAAVFQSSVVSADRTLRTSDREQYVNSDAVDEVDLCISVEAEQPSPRSLSSDFQEELAGNSNPSPSISQEDVKKDLISRNRGTSLYEYNDPDNEDEFSSDYENVAEFTSLQNVVKRAPSIRAKKMLIKGSQESTAQ